MSRVVEYHPFLEREITDAGITALTESPSAALKQFKERHHGDVPIITDRAYQWFSDRSTQSSFLKAQEALGVSDTVLYATSLATLEEFSTRERIPKDLVNRFQDGIIEYFGYITSVGGFPKPDVGPPNMNFHTAQSLSKHIESIPNKNHPLVAKMIEKIQGPNEELARYMLSSEGTAMLGMTIMLLIEKRVNVNKLLPENLTPVEKMQHYCNFWREGPNRELRMEENKIKAEQQGIPYQPKTGISEDVTTKNHQGIHAIISKSKQQN